VIVRVCRLLEEAAVKAIAIGGDYEWGGSHRRPVSISDRRTAFTFILMTAVRAVKV
jgi:hypothetical protein